MRNEIGSWFWSVPKVESENQFFKGDIKWFQSGRHGLRAIAVELRDRGIQDIALPSWCCETMITPFVNNGVAVSFYPVTVDATGNFHQDMTQVKTQALLIMDYFGFQAGDAHVPEGYHGVVVRDTTHRPFTGGYCDAQYYVGSLRKWAGFWTGGYVRGNLSYQVELGQCDANYVGVCVDAMKAKERYIASETNAKEDFLRQFSVAEATLDSKYIYGATVRDVDCAKHLDVDSIFHHRRKNAQMLIDGLREICLFKQIESIDCPLFVPVIVPDGKRDELKKYLIKQEIYCPVHWPVSEYHQLSDGEKFIYDNELSLVCDQRYKEADMQRIVGAIRSFLGQC